MGQNKTSDLKALFLSLGKHIPHLFNIFNSSTLDGQWQVPKLVNWTTSRLNSSRLKSVKCVRICNSNIVRVKIFTGIKALPLIIILLFNV